MEYIGSHIYTDDFIKNNLMGPNPMIILDEICKDIKIERGSFVLDLACGKALTSIYLGNEYDITIFAGDLWINPTENFYKLFDFSLEKKVFPLVLDAEYIPFPKDYFDMVTCINSFHYFGTSKGYIESLVQHVKRNGHILIAVPGLKEEYEKGIPLELRPYIKENDNYHTISWWKDFILKTGIVKIEKIDEVECYDKAWEHWLVCYNEYARYDKKMLMTTEASNLNFIKIILKVL